MTVISLHRIRCQRWQVRAGDQAEAMRWRQALRDDGQQELLAAIATVFDAFDAPQRAWHVPRLQLHLKVSSLAQLREQLPRVLADALRDERWQQEAAGSQRDAIDVSSSVTRLAAVRHYLSTGQLCWQDAHGDRQRRQQTLTATPDRWRQLLCEQLPLIADESAQLLMIWRWLQASATALRQKEVMALFAELAPELAHPVQRFRLIARVAELSGATAFQQLQWLSLLVLRVWQHRQRQLPLPELLLGERETVDNEPTAAAMPHARSGLLRQWLQQPPVQQLALPDQAPARDGVAALAIGNAGNAAPSADIATPIQQLLAVAAASMPVLPLTTRATEAQSVAVLHAGLILLHPFLPQLFRHCQLWQTGDKQLSPWLLPRAAALLHFLATGVETIAEHECGAIKLLLGLAVDAPLPVAEGLLTDADREEADALLAAVVGHWTALKQTSVNGLRLSFLQRPGLLRAEADGWRLHVEREAFDVLLDFLPWGIGVIKLPWMTDAIHTAW